MSEKNEKIIDVIRWILLLPVSIVLFIVGYAYGYDIAEFIWKTFRIELPIVEILPVILMVLGARWLVPKHKKLVTWIVVILWLVVIGYLMMLTYHHMLELEAIRTQG